MSSTGVLETTSIVFSMRKSQGIEQVNGRMAR